MLPVKRGGTQIDFGYSQWHADGTAILNSRTRPPSTQNFCLGVWAQTGPFHDKLNHWGLSSDTAGNLQARVNIREDVALQPRGDAYEGGVTIDVYRVTGKTVLQHVAGQIVGKRMTVLTRP